MNWAILYIFLFMMVKTVSELTVIVCGKLLWPELHAMSSGVIVTRMLVESAILLAIFLGFRFCRVGTEFLRSGAWRIVRLLSLTVVFTATIILPLVYLEECLPDFMQTNLISGVMEMLMRSASGFIVLAIAAPMVEEVIFRGAVIPRIREWAAGRGNAKNADSIAVLVSAFLFALVHLNPAQMPHAFLVGCILGWLFVKTQSIIPGLVMHIVNNSASFVLLAMRPDLSVDCTLSDFFNGDTDTLHVVILTSAFLAVPSFLLLRRAAIK